MTFPESVPIPDDWHRGKPWHLNVTVNATAEDPLPLGGGILHRPHRVWAVDVVGRRDGDVLALRGLPGFTIVNDPDDSHAPPLFVVGIPFTEHADIMRTVTDPERDRLWTAEQAEEAGWNVDRTCYPWTAYQGPRFAPYASRLVVTPAVLDRRDVR